MRSVVAPPTDVTRSPQVSNLKRGIEHFGEGKWTHILVRTVLHTSSYIECQNEYNFNDRTTGDLKDKWRNLKKAGLVE